MNSEDEELVNSNCWDTCVFLIRIAYAPSYGENHVVQGKCWDRILNNDLGLWELRKIKMRGNLKRHCLSGCFPEAITGLCAQSDENSLLRNKLANNFQGSAGRSFFLTWLAAELFVIGNSALDRHCSLFWSVCCRIILLFPDTTLSVWLC